MAANALSTEAIALTEKKMDMTLDDIIKMSKNKASFKGKPRPSNKSQGFLNERGAQRTSKVQRFMSSRSSIRQGVLAQRRTNFKGNQFPVTSEAARRAVVTPIRNKMVNPIKQRVAVIPLRRNTNGGNAVGKEKPVITNKQKPKTLDALFAGMKEQRIRTMSQQVARGRGQPAGYRRGRGWQPRIQGRGAAANFGNYAR